MEEVLKVSHLSVAFGGVRSVDDCSFSLLRDETLGICGANGAGKTTLFDLITGFCQKDRGEIFFLGEKLRGDGAAFTKKGLARTFQNLHLPPSLTVKEQLLLSAAACKSGLSPERLLQNTPLANKLHTLPAALPYGEKKLVELFKAVATGARVICLDEPAAGMNAREKSLLTNILSAIPKKLDVQFLIIEHDLSFLLTLCNSVLVMNRGRVLAEGKPCEVFALPEVKAAFLGR